MRAFIGLGSNLDQPLQQIARAFVALTDLPGCEVLRQSRLYRTPPLGPADQPDYINAVALLETQLKPLLLLDQLQAIERQQGRVRTQERWAPRTLDLDLLLYDTLIWADERLCLPHPRLAERAFVLMPLADVAELTLFIPGMGPLAELLAGCKRSGITVLD